MKKQHKQLSIAVIILLFFISKIVFKFKFPILSDFLDLLKDGVLGLFLFLCSYLLYEKNIGRKKLTSDMTKLHSKKRSIERAIECKNFEFVKDLKVVEIEINQIENQINDINSNIPFLEISLLVMTMIAGALQVLAYFAK